jgi:hypothetical protein
MRQITRRIGQVVGGFFLVLGIFWTGRESTHGFSVFWERWWCPIPLVLTLLGLAALMATNWPRRQLRDAPS